MPLSPGLYHHLVRPRWLTTLYISNIIKERFDFSNKKVLDFGCGTGCCSTMFLPDNYTGIDPARDRIEYARRTYPTHTFRVMETNTLPLEDMSVDCILVISVLHHIPTAELEEYLEEFRRVLKKDGRVIAIEPCLLKDSPLCNRFMNLFDDGKYIRDIRGYADLFNRHGYRVDIMKLYKKLFLYNELCFCASPNYL